MLHFHANRLAKALVAALLIPVLSGCLGDGLPWGQLEASMTASFAPSSGRLDDQGRLKTTDNYVVDDLKVTVGFDAFSLVLAAQGAAGFDPANLRKATPCATTGTAIQIVAHSSIMKTLHLRWLVVQAVHEWLSA